MLLFAKRIRELRKSNGLTQEELGKLVNISKVSISFYESGARMPSLDTLTALCDVFKVDLEYLLGQDNYVVEESKKNMELQCPMKKFVSLKNYENIQNYIIV